MNRLALSILLIGMLSAASAQLEVGLEMKRHIFMRGEPVEATVTIRNLAGKDVILHDAGGNQWFGLEIIKGDTPVGPFEANYQNAPQSVLSGSVVRRKIDILRLYPINEYGTYSIRAAIYFEETGKYISSGPLKVDVSEGHKMWTQTVGVPASKDSAGEYRVVSLLTFQQPKATNIYARVEDDRTGAVFGTYPLGRLVAGTNPAHEFDRDNTLHVFHMVGPGQYYLSKIGVNGEWLGQTVWHADKGRAIVRKKEDGRLVVVGATRTVETAQPGPDVPRLSDRPVALPR